MKKISIKFVYVWFEFKITYVYFLILSYLIYILLQHTQTDNKQSKYSDHYSCTYWFNAFSHQHSIIRNKLLFLMKSTTRK